MRIHLDQSPPLSQQTGWPSVPTAGRRTGWETGSDVDLGIRDDAPPRMDITLNMRRVCGPGPGGPGDRVLISPWSAPGPR
jgi:hypothetical protein